MLVLLYPVSFCSWSNMYMFINIDKLKFEFFCNSPSKLTTSKHLFIIL